MQDRPARRVLFIHRAGVAVESFQGCLQRVQGCIAVLRGEAQYAVHFGRGCAGCARPQHGQGNQQAARGRNHVSASGVPAVRQKRGAQRPRRRPKLGELGRIGGPVRRNAFDAVGLHHRRRRGGTGRQGQRHGRTRGDEPRRNPLFHRAPKARTTAKVEGRGSAYGQSTSGPGKGRPRPGHDLTPFWQPCSARAARPVRGIRFAGNARVRRDLPANWGVSGELAGFRPRERAVSGAGCCGGCSAPC